MRVARDLESSLESPGESPSSSPSAWRSSQRLLLTALLRLDIVFESAPESRSRKLLRCPTESEVIVHLLATSSVKNLLKPSCKGFKGCDFSSPPQAPPLALLTFRMGAWIAYICMLRQRCRPNSCPNSSRFSQESDRATPTLRPHIVSTD
jgi:hypothetical protein